MNFDVKKESDKLVKRGKDPLSGVSTFVRVMSPDINLKSLINAIQLDAQSETGGLLKITTGQYVPKVTFFLRDGVVRVQNGVIYSCANTGNCQQVR